MTITTETHTFTVLLDCPLPELPPEILDSGYDPATGISFTDDLMSAISFASACRTHPDITSATILMDGTPVL